MSEEKNTLTALASSNKQSKATLSCDSPESKEKETSLNLPEDENDFYLYPKPLKPLDSDCCGSGCKVCVFDIFEKQLKDWEERCCQKLPLVKHGQVADDKKLLSESTFRKYMLKEISQETKDTFRYRFDLAFSRSLNIQAGQHIILRVYIKGKAINRQYTPINLICSKGYFELLIKIYPDGVMSQYLQTLKPGTEVEFRGPFGQFSMQQIVKFPRLFLLAAGTGIAPLSCVIESILDNEDDETFVHLLFACRHYGDILMKEELHDWLDFWNFSSLCCLSQVKT